MDLYDTQRAIWDARGSEKPSDSGRRASLSLAHHCANLKVPLHGTNTCTGDRSTHLPDKASLNLWPSVPHLPVKVALHDGKTPIRLGLVATWDRSSICSAQTEPTMTGPRDYVRPLSQEQLRVPPAKMVEAPSLIMSLHPQKKFQAPWRSACSGTEK